MMVTRVFESESSADLALLPQLGEPANAYRSLSHSGRPSAGNHRHRRHSCAIARYHDVMTKKTTTVRLPEELATTVEVVARGRGISVNTLVVDALTAEVERVRHDEEFMGKLREITERDKEILDRLAQ